MHSSPALIEARGHGHLLGFAYNYKTWAYLSTVLATVAFLAASKHKLAFTSRHYALFTATDMELLPIPSVRTPSFEIIIPISQSGARMGRGCRTSTSLQQPLQNYSHQTSFSILQVFSNVYYSHFQISTRHLLSLQSSKRGCQNVY